MTVLSAALEIRVAIAGCLLLMAILIVVSPLAEIMRYSDLIGHPPDPSKPAHLKKSIDYSRFSVLGLADHKSVGSETSANLIFRDGETHSMSATPIQHNTRIE